MDIKQRDFYHLMRRKKKIKLKDIATYIPCSVSLLSRYENGLTGICNKKKKRYQEYIITKN